MNREWSELNKSVQLQIKKKETFTQGINTLLVLRKKLMQQMQQFKDKLSVDDFSTMPYINANGYHSKTIAYSLWHIFRIEDIVVHSLISDDEQIFFEYNYQKRTKSQTITTGNELVKEQIGNFSKQLCIDELYQYITDVDKSTTKILKSLTFDNMKIKITEDKKRNLQMLNVVSKDENAYWLIDYWCSKDIRGLIQMPFSRHWIMHVEACLRIESKLKHMNSSK
ncbi:MAG: phage head-tail adapter protein [Lachnotalea sp.]